MLIDYLNRKKSWPPLTLFHLLIGVVGISLTFIPTLLLLKVYASRKTENAAQVLQQDILNTETEESRKKNIEQDKIDYFLSAQLSYYPQFQNQVKPETIKRVFFLPFEKNDEDKTEKSAWLVEVEKEPKITSHYLLTPLIEKELVDSMSCVSQEENPLIEIELEKVQTVGNGRTLQEKNGYVILSGRKNNCYGGATSGFVSVYSLGTGEKIKLQGDFMVGNYWKGVSKVGNALGILKGIYGFNQPTIVIEYGSFEFAGDKLGEVDIVAYFDLQTGNLKQLIRFE